VAALAAATMAPVTATAGTAVEAEAVSSTRFGAVVKPLKGESYADALARSEARYGRLGIIRYFDRGELDPWSLLNARLTDHPAIVSIRIPPSDVVSGVADKALRTWFSSAPTDRRIWWSYMHEPEDEIARGDYTAAEYRAAFRRVSDIAAEAQNWRLRATLILMCYTVNPKSGRNWQDYYAPGAVDVLGWDCYNHGEKRGVYGKPATLYGNAIATSRDAGLPWGMAEIGSKIADGDDGTGRGAWLRSVASYLYGEGALFVSYFDTNGAGADYRLLDEPSRQAWYDVVSDQMP